MLTSVYAEDLFLLFYGLVQSGRLNVQKQDFSPVLSFHEKISAGGELTKNQASYILKILDKYKNLAAMVGVDYKDALENVQWKRPFRVLDLSKKIYAEEGKKGTVEICVKFPYQLKKEFDEEINVNLSSSSRVSYWDQEDKVRRLNVYDFNLISLYDFAVKHQFEIDDSFMNVLADVEEIWQNADNIVPACTMGLRGVELVNASEDAQQYFEENKRGNAVYNLFLAKSMGYLYKGKKDTISTIASSPENHFWIKDYNKFFGLVNQLDSKVCIILDRASNTLQWLQNFVAEADKMLVSRDRIKVCFRDGKDSKHGLNEWIKAAGVGGKVEEGQIFIFETKPAKWLFKDSDDVKLLVTNNIYPPTNSLARDWFASHPCVIYLGETKPTEHKGQKIVEL